MSSSTRLLVLGAVRVFQPVHGYVVRRELVSWRAQEWASLKPGSIYNALKTLTKEGFLEVTGTDQVGGRPERTIYRLTAIGDEEFRNLLREEWWTVRPVVDPLMSALSFLGFVGRAEAIAALEHRTTQIQGMVRHVEFAIEEKDASDSPAHVREMLRLMNARLLAEAEWSRQFIARLRAGEYTTADDPPWRPGPPAPAPAPRTPRRRPTASPPPPARKHATARGEPADAEREPAGRDRDRRREPAERVRGSERTPRGRKPPARAPRRPPAR